MALMLAKQHVSARERAKKKWNEWETHVAGAGPIKSAHISWRMHSCPPDPQGWPVARVRATQRDAAISSLHTRVSKATLKHHFSFLHRE